MKKPNILLSDISFDKITPGERFSFKRIITASDLEKFAELSGDFNPLHMDEDFASKTRFKKRVVHGMLLGAFISRLIGMHMVGKHALYLGQDIIFKKPAFIGDELEIEGIVDSKVESTKIVVIKTRIFNSIGDLVLEGTAKVMVLS